MPDFRFMIYMTDAATFATINHGKDFFHKWLKLWFVILGFRECAAFFTLNISQKDRQWKRS